MAKELKRKGKAVGVKPREIKQDSLTIVRDDTPKPTLNLKQKIIINWMNRATIDNLTAGSKEYKEKQLDYVLGLKGLFGEKFPQDVLQYAQDKKDIAQLLRSKDETA